MQQLQEVAEQPQQGKLREDRVETSTHAETSSRGKLRARWAEGSHAAIPPGRRWGKILEVPNLLDETLLWEPRTD